MKCNKNNKDKVRVEIEKLPNIYKRIRKPKGKIDNREKITIDAQ
jgi:hypothetical protein